MNYTDADYKRIYNDLERREQESIKAHNSWLMEMKMAINTYNNLIVENDNLDFPKIEVQTDEDIANLDKETLKRIYQEITSYKAQLVDKIETALGLRDVTPETVIDDSTDVFGSIEEDIFDI